MEIRYELAQKERLDKFLNNQLPDITRSQIKKMILSGLIKVNDQPRSVHHWLHSGDIISIEKKSEVKPKKAKITGVKILDQTKNFLVLNKPAGLLVHPTDRGENNTLANWLIEKFPNVAKVGDNPLRPGIVHRLDKEVSGLMVVALNQKYFGFLKNLFAERSLTKKYTALVHGQLSNQEGRITSWLERDKKTGLMKVQTALMDGKQAHTTYEVIRTYKNYTLVRVQIHTGRTHQIRAHFYSIGHSIVGDKLYRTKDIRKKNKTIDMRIFLHADFLSWQDKEKHQYKLTLPKELNDFLKNLK